MMIYCTTQGIKPIFYNNYRSITFTNCESLFYTPITYIAWQLHFSFFFFLVLDRIWSRQINWKNVCNTKVKFT